MDTSKAVTHVSLCAGYGGIDLGLKRAIPTLRTIAFSEVEAFACANLVAKMEAQLLDAAPIWTDVKTFPWDSFRGKVDYLSGGYPCQPFSAAGKRLGESDPRHLWPFIADGIRRMRPGACFFENVEGHITLGLRNVLHDLAGMGYRATWGIFSASEIGATQQRKRVFILAYAGCCGSGASSELFPTRQQAERPHGMGEGWPSPPGQPQHEWEPPRLVGNATLMQRNGCGNNPRSGEQCGQVSQPRDTSGQGFNAIGPSQPALGGDVDGPASRLDYAKLCVSCDNRTDELRLLGNGVVPATAERAFLTLNSRFHDTHKR